MKKGIERLLILGCGYVGEHVAKACLDAGTQVYGTTRDARRAEQLKASGIEPLLTAEPSNIPAEILADVDGVLDSIPLERSEKGMYAGQLRWLSELAPRLSHIRWAGYLSTTGVYGDAGGAWVDEQCECKPTSERGRQRLLAENIWLESGLPVEVFRLAGIYGPGRNIIPKLKAGGYKAVHWDPPHWSGRIHVADIVSALLAAMKQPRPGRIVNLADDEPLPHVDYVTELAGMVGAPAPVILTPEEGEKALSAAALAFFSDNKRVSNRLLHEELLPELKYPSFRNAAVSLAEEADASRA